jgi:hypothetical protein
MRFHQIFRWRWTLSFASMIADSDSERMFAESDVLPGEQFRLVREAADAPSRIGCQHLLRIAMWIRGAALLGVVLAAGCGGRSAGDDSRFSAGAPPPAQPCQPRVQLLPTPRLSDTFLSGVAVSPGGQVWAVGQRYTGPANKEESVILRWDGRRFVRVPAPWMSNLRDVVAPADDAAWAVGPRNEVLHWDSRRWRKETVVRGEAYLKDIAANGPDDVWAVGWGSEANALLVAHWDGKSWKRVPFRRAPRQSPVTPVGPGVAKIYFAGLDRVLALGNDDVWVLGSLADKVPGTPIIARWNGKAWRWYPPPPPAKLDQGLYSLAVLSPQHLWAAGGGRILEWNGRAWTTRGEFKYDVIDLAVRRAEVWAILGLETIARWTGSRWEELGRHPNIRLDSLAVDGNGDVWVPGNRTIGADTPTVLRYRCST